MHTNLTHSNLYSPAPPAALAHPRRPEDVIYQVGTVTAIVLVLISIWIF